MSDNQPNLGQNSDASTPAAQPASAWSSAPAASTEASAQPSATGSAAAAAPYSPHATHGTATIPVSSPPPASPWQQQAAAPQPPPYQAAQHQTAPQPGGWHQQGQWHGGGPSEQTGQIPAWAAATPLAPGTPQHATRRGGRSVLTAVAIAVLAGGVGMAGGYVGAAIYDGEGGTANPVTKVVNAAPAVDRSSLAGIAAAVQPSVVVVSTGSGEGSGVIMTTDGYVVTNNHVVDSAQDRSVTVTYANGTKVKATIVGTDPRTDVAVVKIENGKDLTAAKFGDSDAVRVGDTVLAIGAPLGLQGSVSAGIVSALHRTISENGQPESPFGGGGQARTTIGDAIQTDAAINPGNSGGALVNTNGEVIGINTAIATNGGGAGNIGVGFAISANKAKTVAEQLIKGVKVTHPYLGVNVGEADTGGAQVGGVTAGSPAEKAGLKEGDVITKIGDQAIANSEDLVAAVQRGEVGQSVQITIVRDGATQTLTAVIGDAP
jgi:putative serine protease PepD